ncbi:MAG: pseudouridine synthase [Bacteroidia bacterium]|nr:pseudouridine synthase [Bacteroidia bacterium]
MSDHRHFVLYKPYGYLTQFVYNETRRKRRKLLGELHAFPEGTMAIGRLDEKSEGLLLLTTNGALSQLVRGNSIEKEYIVQVDGTVTKQAIEHLKSGVTIGIHGKSFHTGPCKARIVDSPEFPDRGKPIRDDRHGKTSWVSITITEGKFRQVRKMTAAVGFPTLRLIRIRIGNTHLGQMQPGDVQEVESFDLT